MPFQMVYDQSILYAYDICFQNKYCAITQFLVSVFNSPPSKLSSSPLPHHLCHHSILHH